MAAPLCIEWASTEISHMCLEGCPDVDEHILCGFFDAAFDSCGDATWMLADDIEAAQNALAEFAFFAGEGSKNSDFCNHERTSPFFSHIVPHNCLVSLGHSSYCFAK